MKNQQKQKKKKKKKAKEEEKEKKAKTSIFEAIQMWKIILLKKKKFGKYYGRKSVIWEWWTKHLVSSGHLLFVESKMLCNIRRKIFFLMFINKIKTKLLLSKYLFWKESLFNRYQWLPYASLMYWKIIFKDWLFVCSLWMFPPNASRTVQWILQNLYNTEDTYVCI